MYDTIYITREKFGFIKLLNYKKRYTYRIENSKYFRDKNLYFYIVYFLVLRKNSEEKTCIIINDDISLSRLVFVFIQ